MDSEKRNMRIMDMTKGNSVKQILIFAIPLFIGNIFQQVYSMVDTMVAGYNLGNSAIAAIGVTSSLYALLIDFASGFNSGCAIVVTQCFGSHDKKKMKASIAGMMELDLLITIILTVISLVFLRPLMQFMNTPESIFEQAYSYIVIICAGMAATILYNMFSGILRAFGNSMTSLYFLMLSSALNMGMDVLFLRCSAVSMYTDITGQCFQKKRILLLQKKVSQNCFLTEWQWHLCTVLLILVQ